MKLFKRAFIFALCLMAVLIPTRQRAAADDQSLYIDGSALLGDVFHVYFRSAAAEAPTTETLSLSVDGKAVPVESVAAYTYVDAGTSYFILADGNTSVTGRALGDIKAIAGLIVSGMSRGDNLYVGRLGESFDPNGFEDDAGKMADLIDGIAADAPGSDLYQSVADALELLETAPEVRPLKCLIVIADGLDYNISGISALELQEKIRETQIPVCTVALTYNTRTQERVDAAKNLSAFARQSAGGTALLLGTGGVTNENAAAAVLNLANNAYAAVIPAAELKMTDDQTDALFEMKLTNGEASTSAERRLDVSMLPAAESPAAVDTPVPESKPAETEEPPAAATVPTESEPPAAPDEAPARPVWLPWVLIAAAVIVLAAAALVIGLVVRKKKRRAPESSQPQTGYAPTAAPGMTAGPQLVIVRTGGQEGVRFQLTMKQPLVIGRDPVRAQLILDEDSAVHGVQCRLDWQNGQLTLSEMGPLGSTLVNGVPAGQNVPVSSGDLVRIGSYTYRIFWEMG